MAVLSSYQTFDGTHCVDVFSRPNGTFGFEEFRLDPEDMGVWTPISYHPGHEYASKEDALRAARGIVTWFADPLDQ